MPRHEVPATCEGRSCIAISDGKAEYLLSPIKFLWTLKKNSVIASDNTFENVKLKVQEELRLVINHTCKN